MAKLGKVLEVPNSGGGGHPFARGVGSHLELAFGNDGSFADNVFLPRGALFAVDALLNLGAIDGARTLESKVEQAVELGQ